MWINHLCLAVVGLISGAATAAGTFAFIIIIGVVPRLIGKCHRAAGTMCFENAIILGAVVGCVWTIFTEMSIPLGKIGLMAYGFSAGIFVGCIALELAEILHTFPIVFRRFHIKRGLFWVVESLAFGKMAGAFYFFLTRHGG